MSSWRVLIATLSIALLAAAPPPRGDPRIIGELGVADRDGGPIFSPDGTWLLTVGLEQVAGENSSFVIKWNVRTRKALARFPVEAPPAYVCGYSQLIVSPSGKAFAYCNTNGKVFVRDSTTGKTIFSFDQWEGNPKGADFLAFLDDDHIFTVDDGIGQKRNIRTNRTAVSGISPSLWMKGFASSPRKGLLVYISLTDLAVVKNDLKKDRFSFPHKLDSDKRRLLAVTDDGAYVLASYRSTGLALFDVKGETLLRRWQGHASGDGNEVAEIVAIPGRNVFVTSDHLGFIRFWNAKGEKLAEVRRYKWSVFPLAVSPDGKILATGGVVQPIVLWDLEKILPKKAK